MEKSKSKKLYILSFLIPTIIMFVLFLLFAIPFKNTIFISDLSGQYISLLSYYQDIFISGESFFYSFSKGIGGETLSTISYYLTSPVNIIYLFFDKVNFDIATLVVILIKFGLSGLFSYQFFKYNFKKINKYELLIFSTSYALMMYNVAYFFNIMWIDCIYMLPLVMLGIDKIISEKSSLFYFFMLAISIFSNYYIGFMVCIASILYFLYKLFLKYEWNKHKNEIIKICCKFAMSSLFAGLITAVLMLPNIIDLMNTSKGNSTFFESSAYFSLDIFKFFKSLFVIDYGKSNILNMENQALLYCGILTLILIAFFFFNKKISKKEKILTLLIFVIFFVSFGVEIINVIWHSFSFPIAFNNRFAFICSFFMLYIACRSYEKLEKVSIKECLVILLFFSMIILFNVTNQIYLYDYISLLFVATYLFLIYYVKGNKSSLDNVLKKKIKILLCILAVSELFLFTFTTIRGYEFFSIEEYKDQFLIIDNNIENIEDDNFYRISNSLQYNLNSSLLLGYNGTSEFLSTASSDVVKFYGNINFYNRLNSYDNSSVSDLFVNSILSVKYHIGKCDTKKSVATFQYSVFTDLMYNIRKAQFDICENPYTLGLSYMIDSESLQFIDKLKQFSADTYSQVLNLISSTMFGSELELYTEIVDFYKNDNEISFLNSSTANITLDIVVYDELDPLKNIEVYVNGELAKNVSYRDDKKVIIENNYDIGETIKITYKYSENIEILLLPSYFNEDALQEFYNEISQNQLNITSFKDDHIKGNITVDERNVLFTSIPYSDGWTLYVDGEKVETTKLYGAFLGATLTEGYHEIELKFYPPGLNLGIIISTITLILTILYFKFEKHILDFILKIYLKYEEMIDYLIIGGLTTVISIITYYIFADIYNIHYLISNGLSFVFALIFAYFANRTIVFKSENKEILKEFMLFTKYRLYSLVIDMGLMFLLVSMLNINDLISKIIVQIIIVIINYIFTKLIVFKHK